MYLYDVFLATVTGVFVGVLFSWLRLPIPAPHCLPGVMGVVGVFVGRYAYLEFMALVGRF